MHFDLIKIFHEMDWMARGVTGVLLIMGVASLTVFMERLLAYSKSRRQSRQLAQQAGALVEQHEYSRLLELTERYSGAHLARVLGSGLRLHLSQDAEFARKPEGIEAVRRELLRQHETANNDLRRGLSLLASVGSVAPFVGLLGTVVGIIAAFSKISSTGSGGLSSVAGGISEALVVTALGLMIAIPAVLIYNSLSTQADRIGQGLTTALGQFIDHLELGGPRKVVPVRGAAVREGAQHGVHAEQVAAS